MNKPTSRIIVFITFVVLLAGLSGCCSLKFCKDKILIINQPQNRTVKEGSNATFSVFAVKGPPWTTNGLSYQWQVNTVQLSGNLYWTNLAGATNQSVIITNVELAKVGYYRVLVSGSPTEASAPASLQMVTASGGTITVYGTPVAQSVSGSTCPKPFKGYVNYDNGGAGFIVADRHVNASGANSDPGAQPHHDAKIEYGGYNAFDTKCSNNVLNVITIRANSSSPMPAGSVAVPPPATPSAQYWFTLYFKTLPLPTGQYGLILNNFQE